MTKREREILTLLNDTDDYLIQDGRSVAVGTIYTSPRLVLNLLRHCFISQDSMSPSVYWINDSGRRALRGEPPYACVFGHFHETLGAVYRCNKEQQEQTNDKQ